MELDDIRAAFVSESVEHLESAEKAILELESEKEQSGSEIVKQLFRSLHTIKGGAGFLELTKIKDLSHALESVVGQIREGELAPDRHVTDVLLGGVDKLKSLIEELPDDNIDISAGVRDCEKILNGERMSQAAGNQVPAVGAPVFDLRNYDLGKVKEAGLYLYEFSVDLIKEFSSKNRAFAKFHKVLNRIGNVIDSLPDLETLKGDSNMAGPEKCSILLATALDDPELVAGGLGVSMIDLKIRTIEESTELPPEKTKNPERTGTVEKTDTAHHHVKKRESPDSSIPVDNTAKAAIPLPAQDVPEEGPDPMSSLNNGNRSQKTEQNVRISVNLLDKLMNLVSELVLVRNQNMQASAKGDLERLITINQQLNAITSELQATVMQTRLCPVGLVLSKFTRIVRELSRSLGKEVNLEIIGSDVELDKSIIEAIGDPMTHLVRNAVDHGIESSDSRTKQGKAPQGNLLLRAYHQGGQVHIQIKDDGKGLDAALLKQKAVQKGILTNAQAESMSDRDAYNLMFEAGFSTAEQLTQVSGRGVGMDVVKTVFHKLGGSIDLHSEKGIGTEITVRLPLTLAIMPALIVSVEGNCYAIPQLNIHEVVWLHGAETFQSIHNVDGKEILWLRNKPIPLIRLSELLKIKKFFTNPATGEKLPDSRIPLGDRRQKSKPMERELRKGDGERRISDDNQVSIVIVRVGKERMGIVADQVVDTEELVVKSFHERLKHCDVFAGTAVLGDSRIAMILDIDSIARAGKIEFDKRDGDLSQGKTTSGEEQVVILFDAGGKEQFAIPLYLISRVQEVHSKEIQLAGEREYLNFRGELIPLIRPENALSALESNYRCDCVYVIIPRCRKPIGLLAANILDTVELVCRPDPGNFKENGILGSQFVEGKLTLFLDIFALVNQVEPGWFTEEDYRGSLRFLLVDDTPFYQNVLSSYLKGAGIEICLAGNGKEALQLMDESEFDAVISDIDMPVMDGIEFIRNLRKDQRFKELPVLAISANDTDTARNRAIDNGFNDFRSKLVPQELLDTVSAFVKGVKKGALL